MNAADTMDIISSALAQCADRLCGTLPSVAHELFFLSGIIEALRDKNRSEYLENVINGTTDLAKGIVFAQQVTGQPIPANLHYAHHLDFMPKITAIVSPAYAPANAIVRRFLDAIYTSSFVDISDVNIVLDPDIQKTSVRYSGTPIFKTDYTFHCTDLTNALSMVDIICTYIPDQFKFPAKEYVTFDHLIYKLEKRINVPMIPFVDRDSVIKAVEAKGGSHSVEVDMMCSGREQPVHIHVNVDTKNVLVGVESDSYSYKKKYVFCPEGNSKQHSHDYVPMAFWNLLANDLGLQVRTVSRDDFLETQYQSLADLYCVMYPEVGDIFTDQLTGTQIEVLDIAAGHTLLVRHEDTEITQHCTSLLTFSKSFCTPLDGLSLRSGVPIQKARQRAHLNSVPWITHSGR